MKENTAAPVATHQRSPNYPATSLVDSIGDARKLFESEKRTVLNQESLARAIGYSSLNGASRTRLASLRKYGLIDSVGEGYQISQLAMRIIHQSETSPDHIAAIREAALRPDVFQQFYQTHREASEQAIISELIVKRGYSPEGARLFAKSFRETIVFAKLDQADYSPPDDADKIKDKPPAAGMPAGGQVNPPAKPPMNTQVGELPVPIADGLVARVPFPMTEDDFDLLIGTLNLWKKKLIGAVKPTARQYPAEALWKNKDFDKLVTIVGEMGEQGGEKYFQSKDGTGIPASELWFNP